VESIAINSAFDCSGKIIGGVKQAPSRRTNKPLQGRLSCQFLSAHPPSLGKFDYGHDYMPLLAHFDSLLNGFLPFLAHFSIILEFFIFFIVSDSSLNLFTSEKLLPPPECNFVPSLKQGAGRTGIPKHVAGLRLNRVSG
jgi:hypothetical protein